MRAPWIGSVLGQKIILHLEVIKSRNFAPRKTSSLRGVFLFMHSKKYSGRSLSEIDESEDQESQREANQSIKHRLRKIHKRREARPVATKNNSAVANVKVNKL